MVTEKCDFEIVQKVWDRAKKLTTGEKNNKFVLDTDNMGRMVFRMAAEEFDIQSCGSRGANHRDLGGIMGQTKEEKLT